MRSEEGLILLNESGMFLWANQSASDLLSYSRSELCGGGLDAVGPMAMALRDVVSGLMDECEGEARLPSKQDKRIAVHWKLWAVPSPESARHFLLSISQTAQAASEGPITAGYRDIFEYAVEGIFRSTIEGRFLEVNPALARIFGYGSSIELTDGVQNIYHTLYVHPERGAEVVKLLLNQGFVAGVEAEMFTKDRAIIWVAIFARTVRGGAGEALYFEGSVIDITERKQTEGALRWSEERFRRLAETTRVVPFEFDPSTEVFTYVAPQAEALFGPDFRRGMTLRRFSALIHPADVASATKFALDTDLAEKGDVQTEFRIPQAPGRGEVWVKQIVHREATNKRPQRVRGFLLEITASKKVEEERERSRIQLRELAARTQVVREEERMSVAREIHDELGQALTLLRIDLSWLHGRLANVGSEEVTNPLREKIGGMEQLTHWTLQSMRRILASLRPPLLEELGLKDAIEFHLQSFSKRLAIRYECDATPVASLPVITATAVFRIFQEILTNIARHANASRVKVSLGQDDAELFLRVQDNGLGITQEALGHSRSFGLLGMQERAWAIGGEIEIHGSPRSGTTVLLKVPLPPAPTTSSKETELVPTQIPVGSSMGIVAERELPVLPAIGTGQ